MFGTALEVWLANETETESRTTTKHFGTLNKRLNVGKNTDHVLN